MPVLWFPKMWASIEKWACWAGTSHICHLLQQQYPHQLSTIHLHLWGGVINTVVYLFPNVLFRQYHCEKTSTRLFHLPIFELNLNIIISHYSQETPHHLLYNPSDYFPLELYSISTNFSVTPNPIAIFIFTRFSPFLSLISWSTGEIMVVLGVVIY